MYEVHYRSTSQASARTEALQCHVGRPSHETQYSAPFIACIPVAGFTVDGVHIYSKETTTLAFEFIHYALRWTLGEGCFIKIHIGLSVGL